MNERMVAEEAVDVLADVVHGMPVGGAKDVRVTRSAEGYDVVVREAQRETPDVAARWAREIVAMQATAWPLHSVLKRLADAAEHLLHDHDCDNHGWEGVGYAVEAARGCLARLTGPAEAPSTATRSLAEIGRDAAKAAQKAALLGALEASGWRITDASVSLGLGHGTGNILRAIRSLELVDEYRAAKAAGRIKRGAPSHKANASRLTHSTECATVAA